MVKKQMKNPFYIRELPLDAPFCNREKEINELVRHGKNRMNVILYSPRRFGKTSLAKRAMSVLSKEMTTTIYMDFMGTTSIDEIAERIAVKTYQYTYAKENLFKKVTRIFSSWRPVLRPDPETGLNITVESVPGRRGRIILEETLQSLGKFSSEAEKGCYIVFDEFQEITEIKDSITIEGIMRSEIQQHNKISYLFIGSRRRVLLDMFNQKKRPFYQSGINYSLNPLNTDILSKFLVEQFHLGNKICPDEIAQKISERVHGYPYYVQKIAYFIYELSGKKITENDYYNAFKLLLESEKPLFEVMIQSLAGQQIALLVALAKEPTGVPFSAAYMSKHQLGSIGGVQGAIKKLISLDYIEKSQNIFSIVDPIFATWLTLL
ncbi:MAG: ATP-binding protein [Elusimicrobia bacterium CG_4_10_14_0_8_um_filter_37_32]|nr:MAG: ATP-binding protein [Elusimicrobia bacterium CG02_land_8_20_14_3_00_37_13]PIZ13807.1 MAG: ATP-binding protein [Elusimicrobia bacterium CG_4_10_14_0_8_um_filter_37_32]